jgi:broad specificity phosphatase PhoE
MSVTTQIYLVRHGQTDWNRAQRLQGGIDTVLNPIGVAQADAIADRLRPLTGALVVTSPLARARQTANAIVTRNRWALAVDARLAEIDHGGWSGLTHAAIERACPGAIASGQLRPEAVDLSGGEPLIGAYRRASGALRRLLSASPSEPVVVVSHGVINALLVCAAVGHSPTQIDRYPQANGFVYRFDFRRRTLVGIERSPFIETAK